MKPKNYFHQQLKQIRKNQKNNILIFGLVYSGVYLWIKLNIIYL